MTKCNGALTLVCLDLGGVMIRIASDWADALRRAGIDIAPADVAHARSKLESHRPILDELETGRIDEDTYLDRASEHLGIDRDTMKLFVDVWLIEPYPRMGDLLDELRAAGLTTACLSNTSPGHWRQMHEPGAVNLPMSKFDHAFASHLIGVLKPSPAAFEHVERATGAAPDHIAFFDDTQANVDAAAQRGWRAWRIDPRGDTAVQIREHLRGIGAL